MSIKKAAGGKQPVFKLNKGELWAFAVRRVVELLQKRRETVSNCVFLCVLLMLSPEHGSEATRIKAALFTKE